MAAEPSRWTATALVHSGRPDPRWAVDDAVAERLLTRLGVLRERTTALPKAPALGFRGVVLRDAATGRVWTAYRDAVHGPDGPRIDPDRVFLAGVLATAPAGLLPPWAVP